MTTEPKSTDWLADMLVDWFCENTDLDGQWGSAADFIEHAAQALLATGRNVYDLAATEDSAWFCDECEGWIDGPEAVSRDHDRDCSLHPDNVV